MAMALPLLGVLGSVGSSAGLLSGIATVVSIGSTIAGGIEESKQADSQARQAELEDQRNEINSRMEQLDVGEELLQTLSRNTAQAAASGLASSGSVARAQEASRKSAAEELNVLRTNQEAQSDAAKVNIDALKSTGKSAVTKSLFDAAGQGFSKYKAYKKVK